MTWGDREITWLFGCDVCGREITTTTHVKGFGTILAPKLQPPRPAICPDCGAPQSWGVMLRKDYPRDKARADHRRFLRSMGFYGPEEVR